MGRNSIDHNSQNRINNLAEFDAASSKVTTQKSKLSALNTSAKNLIASANALCQAGSKLGSQLQAETDKIVQHFGTAEQMENVLEARQTDIDALRQDFDLPKSQRQKPVAGKTLAGMAKQHADRGSAALRLSGLDMEQYGVVLKNAKAVIESAEQAHKAEQAEKAAQLERTAEAERIRVQNQQPKKADTAPSKSSSAWGWFGR